MPPFRYTRPVDPYVGSIAELMGQRGQREADTAERIAAIRAQEATQRGQIWGGAIQGIGDLASKIPEQMQKAKEQEFQDSQRKRLLEEQGRSDDARTLWRGMQDVETLPSRQGLPTIETTLPARFGYPDANDGFTEVDVPSETHRGFEMISRPGETTNPYKELDKDGIQALDLWDINAAEKSFAEQGLGIEGQQYIKWMDESNTRMEAHHANALMMAGDSAKKIIGLPSYPEMLNATETLLEKFGNNGVFSSRDLESFGSNLATIKGMPIGQQEAALKGLLVQMIPGGEETMTLVPGSRAVGALSGRTVAEGQTRPENLTAEEQALDAYARSLYPEYKGSNPRHLLTDEDRVEYAQRRSDITRSYGANVWTPDGLMRATADGYVPATDTNGNQLQPRNTGDTSFYEEVTDVFPIDSMSQDLLSRSGLSFNAFMVLTGNGGRLARDRETRNRASADVEAWARRTGQDISTFQSQYVGYNKALQQNVMRRNNTLTAESEIIATIENLDAAAKDAGLDDIRAFNEFQIFLAGEVNSKGAATYAFHLNQLRNDLAQYNAASQGRTGGNMLQSDITDAEKVFKQGISGGSLEGIMTAVKRSVERQGMNLEAAVNRTRLDVWKLFGLGNDFVPSNVVIDPDGNRETFDTAAQAEEFQRAIDEAQRAIDEVR